MRTTLLLLAIVVVPLTLLYAQPSDTTSKHQLRLSVGLAAGDGLVNAALAPTLGIGYEYRLSKRWSAAAHILSYYQSAGELNSIFSPAVGVTADLVIRGIQGPFITPADWDRIEQTGIKKINSANTLKLMSIPIDIGFIFYPLVHKRHRLGLNAAVNLTYESYNFFIVPHGVIIELEDGTIYQDVFLSLNTEFRHLVMGLNAKMFYEYHFDRMAIGLRASTYNVIGENIDFLGKGEPIWDSSLYITVKF